MEAQFYVFPLLFFKVIDLVLHVDDSCPKILKEILTELRNVQLCSKRMGRRQIISSRYTTVRMLDSWMPRFTR